MTNDQIARRIRDHASDLARAGDNLYRVRAFRRAAMAVLALERPAAEVLALAGRGGLAAQPGIGASLAATIEAYAAGGEWTPRPPAAVGRVRLAAG